MPPHSKPLLPIAALLLAVLTAGAAAGQESDRPVVRVGIVLDGPGASNETITELMTAEIREVNRRRFEVLFPEASFRVGDWTVESARRHLESLLEDDQVDVVMAMGVIAGAVAVAEPELPKPVIAPFVVDPELGGVELVMRRTADGRSIRTTGRPNLSLTVPSWDIERDFAEFRRWVPFERAALLMDARILEAIPQLRARLDALAAGSGATYQLVPVGESSSVALENLDSEVDAAVVGVLVNVPQNEVAALYEGLAARGLPSFALMGRQDVERGAMLGLAAETELRRLARRTAIHLQRILLGEAAGQLPVDMPVATRLTFNRSTAREVGYAASWELLIEAEVLEPVRRDVSRRLGIREVIETALRENLELRVLDATIDAGWSAVDSAGAGLRPQAALSTSGLWIDADRARASFGSQAERTWSASLSASWQLLAESSRAAVDVADFQQQALLAEREQLRLDIAEEAAVGLLNVVRARTAERIRRENLDVTRFNLELARQRRLAGAATAADEARWESEIAFDQQELIDAVATRNQAEIELNRLLNAPLEEPFEPLEEELLDLWRNEYEGPLELFLGTQEGFDVFREFMAREALLNAPELARIDRLIEAQRRVLTATGRSFWLPDVALQGQLLRRLAEGGAGGSAAGGPFPGFQLPDDTEWNVAVSASLPLYAGGFRFSERARALSDLERLHRLRRATAERIEQRARNEMHQAGASWSGIGLSARARAAALRNLELVQAAYGQGLGTVIQLVDAQNAALVADLAAQNAIYDYLIDIFNVERSVADFRLLSTPEEQAEWRRRLDEYFQLRREKPDAR